MVPAVQHQGFARYEPCIFDEVQDGLGDHFRCRRHLEWYGALEGVFYEIIQLRAQSLAKPLALDDPVTMAT
jgi:hypothetical protein